MKRIASSLIVMGTMIISSCSNSRVVEDARPVAVSVSYQQFYDGLSPYGQWIDYPGYGYVWQPGESGFRPYYSNGHWAYTGLGWTWVSSYNWGWAPFHYGRWFNDPAYGWMWTPGYEWAPAWVSWRRNEECYGWAPLGPRIGINVSISTGIPYEHWAFVPREHITETNINNYYINQTRNITIINNSMVINNTYNTSNKTTIMKGPDVKEVENVTHTKIKPLQIKETDKPGSTTLNNGALNIYKLQVKEDKNSNIIAKPKNPVAVKDLPKNNGSTQNGMNDNKVVEKVRPVKEEVKSVTITKDPPGITDKSIEQDKRKQENLKSLPGNNNPGPGKKPLKEPANKATDTPVRWPNQQDRIKTFDPSNGKQKQSNQNNMQRNNTPPRNMERDPAMKRNNNQPGQKIRVLQDRSPIDRQAKNGGNPKKDKRGEGKRGGYD